MTLYNVLVPVIDLIEAESEADAIRILRAELMAAGFDPHEEGQNAFESEAIANDGRAFLSHVVRNLKNDDDAGS